MLTQNGYLAGAPTYVPMGELAICNPLHGELPRPAFPDALAAAAPERWNGRAAVSLTHAQGHARARDAVACIGMLAHAVLCAAHARLARRREWVIGEKRLVARAGLEETEPVLARPDELPAAVAEISRVLGVEPLAVR